MFSNRPMLTRFFIALFSAFIGLTAVASPDGSDVVPRPMVISIVIDNPLTAVGIQLMRKVYQQAGYPTRFVTLSVARSENLLHSGDVDAELARAEGLDKISENMIKVPEPLMTVNIAAYTLRNDITSASTENLDALRIGIRHGLTIDKRFNPKNLTQVYRLDQLAQMLKHNRIDVAILSETSAFFSKHKFNLNNLRALAPELARFNVYHYIHKRHRNLIPQLSRRIRELKDDGTIKAMITEFMQKQASAR